MQNASTKEQLIDAVMEVEQAFIRLCKFHGVHDGMSLAVRDRIFDAQAIITNMKDD